MWEPGEAHVLAILAWEPSLRLKGRHYCQRFVPQGTWTTSEVTHSIAGARNRARCSTSEAPGLLRKPLVCWLSVPNKILLFSSSKHCQSSQVLHIPLKSNPSNCQEKMACLGISALVALHRAEGLGRGPASVGRPGPEKLGGGLGADEHTWRVAVFLLASSPSLWEGC